MKDPLIYRPYGSPSWLVFMIVLFTVFVFILAGHVIPDWHSALLWGVMGIVAMWFIKVFYDASNAALLFEENGLWIMGGNYKKYRYVFWKEVPYAYYVIGCKGHPFFVLSPKPLLSKEIRHLANRGEYSTRICIDQAIVIFVDVSQNTSQLEEIIGNHVLHVCKE